MKKQVGIMIPEALFKLLRTEASNKQIETGEYCSLSKLAGEIFIPALEAHFTKRVSPPSNETKSIDDSQNETEIGDIGQRSNPFDLNIDF